MCLKFEIELKKLIKEKYGSIRAFSQAIDTPYSTIDNIFKRGILGVSIQVVLRICSALNIDVEKIKDDQLILKGENLEKTQAFKITPDERTLVVAYREHPEMQPAINKMLDITPNVTGDIADDIINELKKEAQTPIKLK